MSENIFNDECRGKRVAVTLLPDGWIREIPNRKPYILCLGAPGQTPSLEPLEVKALFDVICGNRATELDLERGAFLCEKCAEKSDWVFGSYNATEFASLWHLHLFDEKGLVGTDIERANTTLRLIRKYMFKVWRKRNPRRWKKHFEPWFRKYWEDLGDTLTYQTGVSLEWTLGNLNN